MTFTEINIAQRAIPNATTLLYTVPANKKVIIREITIDNVTVNNQTFSIWADVNGNVADINSAIMSNFTLLKNDAIRATFFIVMEAGGTIYASCSTNNAVCMTINGAIFDLP